MKLDKLPQKSVNKISMNLMLSKTPGESQQATRTAWVASQLVYLSRLFVGAALLLPATLSAQTPADLWPASLVRLGKGGYFPNTAIVVDKKSRTVAVWEGQDAGLAKVREYASDFGKNIGDKLAGGDYKTPEGIYFLQTMLEGEGLPFDKYGQRAFTTDYPNLFDRREGKTGNGIWIHAIPDTQSLERGSRGCVVVRNKSIMDISPFVRLKQTVMIIHDEVRYIEKDLAKANQEKIQKWVQDWRVAWESKNISQYMEFYSSEFESMKMKKAQWKAYKSGLAEKYPSIQVQLSPPVAFEHKNQMVIRVLQKYKSETHEDFGEKTLYLKNDNGTWGIIAEQWEAAEATPAALSELQQGTSTSAQFNTVVK